MKFDDLVILLSFFTFFTILIVITLQFIKNQTTPDVVDTSEDKLLDQENKLFSSSKIEDINNIKIEPYGCFTNLKNQFFQEKVNPYSKDKNVISSSYYFTNNEKNKNEIRNLILDVIKNGYSKFGNDILKRYL
jgi:hypothetical protein